MNYIRREFAFKNPRQTKLIFIWRDLQKNTEFIGITSVIAQS